MRIELENQHVFVSPGSPPIREKAPTIVCVHGAGHDHSVWTMYSRFFVRKGYNAIAPDLPGHGQSDGQPLGTISDMAIWVTNILHLLNIQKAVFVGHSMGSLVAAQLATDRPPIC